MSSLFGQVWLWSLLSFVAGVALTWLVLVRPAKRELEDLEKRLHATPPPSPVTSTPSRSERSDVFGDWQSGASRSLADDVLTPEPVRHEVPERPRFEPVPEPARYERAEARSGQPGHDLSTRKPDRRDAPLEEPDDERRPLSDFEERRAFPGFETEPPRSLFERLTSENGGRETPEPTSRPRQYAPEDEPELPVEETQLMPAVPVAEVAPPQEEPVAPPEVETFQPREVWREEPVQEVYDQDEVPSGHEEEDEPERRPSSTEETSLIPATALAQAIAEVDREQRQAEDPEPQGWPEHDLTGHFTPVDVESSGGGLARSEREAEGPETDVIRAVVEPAPRGSDPRESDPRESNAVESAPEVGGSPSRSRTRTPESAASEPLVAAEPEVAHTVPDDEPEAVRPGSAAHPAEPSDPAESRTTGFQPAEPKSAEPKPAEVKPAEPKKDEPARPRSLFEPVPEDEEPEPEPERPRPAPRPAGSDQPFVPTLAPELLAGKPVPMNGNGLPQRPARQAGTPRKPSSPAPLAPKPATPTPPPARPVRPRPVGFSPSTGGRPAPGTTRFRGQQEGFNPRSPFGPGSVLPKSDGMAPAPEFQVKATLTGRRYFTDESANFRETRADVWFRTTADAEKAGFRPAP